MKCRLSALTALFILAQTAHAQQIEPYKAKEVKPVTAGSVQPNKPASEVKLNKPGGPASCAASAPAGTPAPDARILGGWAVIVPGGAYTQEIDRGSYLERIQQVSLGAPAGALTITKDGQFKWQKRSGTTSGSLGWCTSTRGESGWVVRFDKENFFVRFVEGRNGGFYLFSTATGFVVYQGKAVK
jgi:hypothetical protein